MTEHNPQPARKVVLSMTKPGMSREDIKRNLLATLAKNGLKVRNSDGVVINADGKPDG